MLRKSEEWMFSCQVKNQSVENGSWPLDGERPATSLYRRNRRSYDSVVSDSSTCKRAPRSISVTARSISRDSFRMLLCAMAGFFATTTVVSGVLDITAPPTHDRPSECWHAAGWWLRYPPCGCSGW